MKEVVIAGGGLAGLGLAHALRNRGVPVSLHEAARYPRHRVCGEFISGVSAATLAELGIEDAFADAARHRSGTWHRMGRQMLAFELPEPALAVSRHRLDLRLKEEFERIGGRVFEGSRLPREARPGIVWSAGRRLERGPWIGLKAHFQGLDLSDGLEMHLGRNGYAGLTPVENGRVNVCALFRLDRQRSGRGPALLFDYLAAGGNAELAERLSHAAADSASFLGVSGFELGWRTPQDDLCAIGDAAGMIPPLTGNGMSMAFEAAETAIEPLLAWSCGESGWDESVARLREVMRRRFSRRVACAMALQGLLLQPFGAALASGLSRTGLLPFRPLLALVR